MIIPAYKARKITQDVLAQHRRDIIDAHRLYIDNVLDSVDQTIQSQANKGATAARLDIGSTTLGVTNPLDRAEIMDHIKSRIADAGYGVQVNGNVLHINWHDVYQMEF